LKAGDLVWVDSLVSARDDPDAQFLIGFYSGTAPELMAKAWPHGCFGEKLVLPIENCFVLPPSLFLSKAEGGLGYQVKDIAALSFILVCFAGLLDADVGPGKTVIVAPATGKFSGGAVLGALALGAKVVAASRNEERLSTLYSLPYANERLSTVKMTGEVKNDTAALLKAVGGDGKGAHVYMDVTPPLPSPGTPPHFKAALGALRRNAQLILEGGLMADISFNYFSAMTRNLTIKGKFMYERGEVEQCIRTIENGNLIIGEKAGLTIKGVFGLKEVDKALEMEGTSEWWGGDVLLAPNAEV
jgi:threonine dehydrogenase-like Zn-dependent dehydrogenase